MRGAAGAGWRTGVFLSSARYLVAKQIIADAEVEATANDDSAEADTDADAYSAGNTDA